MSEHIESTAAAVAEGARLLDEYEWPAGLKPWFDRIDLSTLNVAMADSCVLGQLFRDQAEYDSGYLAGLQELEAHTDALVFDMPFEYGFNVGGPTCCYADAEEQWTKLIVERRKAAHGEQG